jgi:hypothetical protein
MGMSLTDGKLNTLMQNATSNEMDYFENLKLFSKFFPHNNFDKILSKIKEKEF